MSTKQGVKLLSQQNKKISLRCPLVLDSVRLMRDFDHDQYSLQVSLDYPSGGAESLTVRSVGLSVRILDAKGNVIPICGSEEPFGKQVRFENGFSYGEKVSFAFPLEISPSAGTRFCPPEVSISRIHFEDGSLVDYLRGDFFPMPASPVPLEKAYLSETVGEIQDKFGENAKYVPERLSSIVWRCTCGELCQEEGCASCRSTRTAVFDYFGDTERVLHPKFDYMTLLKRVLIAVGSVVALLIVILVVVLMLKKCDRGSSGLTAVTTSGSAVTTSVAPEGTTDADPGTTSPNTSIDIGALVDYYLEHNDFANALLIAQSEGSSMGNDTVADICTRAIEYYRQAGDYEQAISFANELKKISPDYDLTFLYQEAFDQSLGAGDLESAYQYATLMGDSEKQGQVVDRQINALLEENLYDEALAKAQSGRPDRTEEIIAAAIEYYKTDALFAEALSFAAKSADADSLTRSLNLEAAGYYLDLAVIQAEDPVEASKSAGSYRQAYAYAKASGDTRTFRTVCELTPLDVIRASLPDYFEGLQGNLELLRQVLGHTVAAGRFGAKINADGTVSYGAGYKYKPIGTSAVSVAVGETHAVVLLANGRVIELGSDGSEKTLQTTGNAVAVAAGKGYTLVLNAGGTLKIYGSDLPTGLSERTVAAVTDVVSIAAGERHILVLHANGQVEALGTNDLGQCSVSGWTNAIAIAAGAEHSLALLSDGTVVSCGNGQGGRLDVSSWTGVVAIAAGRTSSVALLSDGTVRFVGGTIGVDPADPSSLQGITEIAAGEFGMIAKSESADGTVRYYSVGKYAPDLNVLDLEVQLA